MFSFPFAHVFTLTICTPVYWVHAFTDERYWMCGVIGKYPNPAWPYAKFYRRPGLAAALLSSSSLDVPERIRTLRVLLRPARFLGILARTTSGLLYK